MTARKYPHRVVRIRMAVYDEETGEKLFKTHSSRIHENDLRSGRMHHETIADCAWKDAEFYLTKVAAD